MNQVTHTAYVATLTGLTAFDTRTCNATTQTGCGQVGVFTLCTGCFGPFSAKVDEARPTPSTRATGTRRWRRSTGARAMPSNLAGCAAAPFGEVTLPPVFFEHIISLVVDTRLHTAYAVVQKNDAVIAIDMRVCNGSHARGLPDASSAAAAHRGRPGIDHPRPADPDPLCREPGRRHRLGPRRDPMQRAGDVRLPATAAQRSRARSLRDRRRRDGQHRLRHLR